jgi:hypothetical protein
MSEPPYGTARGAGRDCVAVSAIGTGALILQILIAYGHLATNGEPVALVVICGGCPSMAIRALLRVCLSSL